MQRQIKLDRIITCQCCSGPARMWHEPAHGGTYFLECSPLPEPRSALPHSGRSNSGMGAQRNRARISGATTAAAIHCRAPAEAFSGALKLSPAAPFTWKKG
jgi:hypothetical protein